MGCEKFCTQEVVADSEPLITQKGATFVFNSQAIARKAKTETDLNLHCGCNRNQDNGKFCDGNFDGVFEGQCNTAGDCV